MGRSVSRTTRAAMLRHTPTHSIVSARGGQGKMKDAGASRGLGASRTRHRVLRLSDTGSHCRRRCFDELGKNGIFFGSPLRQAQRGLWACRGISLQIDILAHLFYNHIYGTDPAGSVLSLFVLNGSSGDSSRARPPVPSETPAPRVLAGLARESRPPGPTRRRPRGDANCPPMPNRANKKSRRARRAKSGLAPGRGAAER